MLHDIREMIVNSNFGDLVTYGEKYPTIIPVIFMFRQGMFYIIHSVMYSQTLINIRNNPEVILILGDDDDRISITARAKMLEDWAHLKDDWLEIDSFAKAQMGSSSFASHFWKRYLLLLSPTSIRYSDFHYSLEMVE